MESAVRRFAASLLIVASSAALPVWLSTPLAAPLLVEVRPMPPAITVSLADFRRILVRNQTIGVLAVSGLFTGGVTTVTPLGALGFNTARVVIQAQAESPLPLSYVAALLLPHGVIEIAGFGAAGAAGLGGLPVLIALADGRRVRACALFHQSVRCFGAAVAAITLAAVVEVVVTPRVAMWVAST